METAEHEKTSRKWLKAFDDPMRWFFWRNQIEVYR